MVLTIKKDPSNDVCYSSLKVDEQVPNFDLQMLLLFEPAALPLPAQSPQGPLWGIDCAAVSVDDDSRAVGRHGSVRGSTTRGQTGSPSLQARVPSSTS